jgi:homoserine kinase
MSLTVVVPATLANLGPGFDVLGMAVDVVNSFRFERRDDGRFEAEGREVDPNKHLCFATALAAQERFGGEVAGLALWQEEQIPRCRGMGSSATACVAGFLAWCWLNERYPPTEEALEFVADQEGHPDNAVAAMLGGLTIAGRGASGLKVVPGRWPARLRVALCSPEREISTAAARASLRTSLPLEDAVYTGSRLGLLLGGLFTDDEEAIAAGLSDRLHEPSRAPLIGPVEEAIREAVAAGATGGFISGSGSTLAAFVLDEKIDPLEVAKAMCAPFERDGIQAVARSTRPRSVGAWGDAMSRAGYSSSQE